MDELEAARRLGREGQTAIGLSVQEQGAYDRGRRERQAAMDAWATPTNRSNTNTSNDSAGGAFFGLIAVAAFAAPAFAAPGLAIWATWMWLAATQGWDWPALTAICVAEAVVFFFLIRLFVVKAPAVVVAVVTAVYLGVAYGLCAPLLTGTSVMLTALIAIAVAAAGFLAGLMAPNKWMSAPLIACGVAIVLGGLLNFWAWRVVPFDYFDMMLPLKWAGSGLALGGLLRLIFLSKWSVIGAIVTIPLAFFAAPGLIQGVFATATGTGLMS